MDGGGRVAGPLKTLKGLLAASALRALVGPAVRADADAWPARPGRPALRLRSLQRLVWPPRGIGTIAAAILFLGTGAAGFVIGGHLDQLRATQGTLADNGPDATIKLDKLGGTLRKKPVSGQADLRVKPGYVVDGTLNLASGQSRVDVNGAGGKGTDATIKLAIASLGDWLPDAGGRLDGQFRVHGKWPAFAVDGRAHGAQIASGTRSRVAWRSSLSEMTDSSR